MAKKLGRTASLDASDQIEWWLVVPKRERYQLQLKKGSTPLGLKLLETRCKRGVLVNGFTASDVTHPGLNFPPRTAAPQLSSINVGDILQSIDGEPVGQTGLQGVLQLIEQARRRDRLRELMTSASAKDGAGGAERKEFTVIFERLSAAYTLQDVLLDPRKVTFFMSFLEEREKERREAALIARLDSSYASPNRVRRATIGTGSSTSVSAGSGSSFGGLSESWRGGGATGHGPSGSAGASPLRGRLDTEALSEAALEQAAAACLTGSKDAAKVRFLIEAARLRDLCTACPADEPQPDWGTPLLQYLLPDYSSSDSESDLCIALALDPTGDLSAAAAAAAVRVSRRCRGSGAPAAGTAAGALLTTAADDDDSSDSTAEPAWALVEALIVVAEADLCSQAFPWFQASAWHGRMLSHLHGSPSHVPVPVAAVLKEPALRDVFMLHLLQLGGGQHHWLQAYCVIETEVRR
jgi:hypothetical protein